VATISPSRLGGLAIHQEVLRQFVETGERRLGPLLAVARERFYRGAPGYWGHRDTYNLLGDPALTWKLAEPVQPDQPAVAQAPAPQPPETGEAPPPEQLRYRRGEPGRMRGGPLDQNQNAIDDRLEKLVRDKAAQGRGGDEVEVAILLSHEPTDATVAAIERAGGWVKARGRQPPALLVRIPADRALGLDPALGDEMRFLRWGANAPRHPVAPVPGAQ
jgi:hypothetical protein